jgi:SAM-dependent methyltransferase
VSTERAANDVIYQRPDDFDLEHEQDERDIGFYQHLLRRLRPSRVLDLGCGSGRVTLPLAHVAAEHDIDIVGVDVEEHMLARAREKCADLDDRIQRRLTLTLGDMRTWQSKEPFDLVLITCSSIAHLLSLDDRLAVWRRAFEHLRPGGHFVVDVTMPDLRVLAESLQTPPRALLEVDTDATDPQTGRRLVRYKTTSFDAFEQRATIKFFYDRFDGDDHDRYLSEFESHVYFPDELRLLFVHGGFTVEAVWGDYSFRRARSWSREIVMVGRRS